MGINKGKINRIQKQLEAKKGSGSGYDVALILPVPGTGMKEWMIQTTLWNGKEAGKGSQTKPVKKYGFNSIDEALSWLDDQFPQGGGPAIICDIPEPDPAPPVVMEESLNLINA